MIKQYCILYGTTMVIMLAMDMLWLKGIAHSFYQQRLGDMLEFRTLPAILFYLLYGVGIVVFVSGNAEKWQTVLLYGSFFGLVAYATYDLTNLGTLRAWPLSVTLVDMAWGVFNTGLSATVGWCITRLLTR